MIKYKLEQDPKIVKLFSSMEKQLNKIDEEADKEINKLINAYENHVIDEATFIKDKDSINIAKAFNKVGALSAATTKLYFDYEYNVTTEDISLLLDLEPLYITRNLRDYYIRSCNIPHSPALEGLLPIMDYIQISKKKFLYSRNDLNDFIKHYIFKSDKYINVDIQDVFSAFDLEEDKIKLLAEQYINKLSKKYKNDDLIPIGEDDFNNIMSGTMQLLRLDSIKEIVKHNLLLNRYNRAIKMLNRELIDNPDNERVIGEIEIIENEKEKFKNRSYSFNPINIKKANMINQKQLERFINKREHTKYYIVLDNNKKIHIALYGIDDTFNIDDVENNYSIAIPESVLNAISEAKIKSDLIKYIKKNKDKEVVED